MGKLSELKHHIEECQDNGYVIDGDKITAVLLEQEKNKKKRERLAQMAQRTLSDAITSIFIETGIKYSVRFENQTAILHIFLGKGLKAEFHLRPETMKNQLDFLIPLVIEMKKYVETNGKFKVGGSNGVEGWVIG